MVHAGTNDIKRINILNTTNKIERKVKILYPVEDSSSGILQRNIVKRQKKKVSHKKYLMSMIGTTIAIRQNSISLIDKTS